MGKVTIQRYTINNPISMMGEEAGICWNADTSDNEKNFKRGLQCLKNKHGRVMEFVQAYIVLDGYSARVIRELYTHIGGAPTRLQESTRYVDCTDFEYIVPNSISQNEEALKTYTYVMDTIKNGYSKLQKAEIPQEDIANILPLGMHTKIILRTNLRHLMDMAEQRLCGRAYWEYRELMKDIIKELSYFSDEWDYLINDYHVFQRKCEVIGYCPESKSCGYMSQKR